MEGKEMSEKKCCCGNKIDPERIKKLEEIIIKLIEGNVTNVRASSAHFLSLDKLITKLLGKTGFIPEEFHRKLLVLSHFFNSDLVNILVKKIHKSIYLVLGSLPVFG